MLPPEVRFTRFDEVVLSESLFTWRLHIITRQRDLPLFARLGDDTVGYRIINKIGAFSLCYVKVRKSWR